MRISTTQAKYFSALHQEALSISREIENQEYLLVVVLQKIEKEKVFRFLGFKSLFQYAVMGLKLSRDRAYNLITVSRKALEIESLQKALKENRITLSKAKRISSVVTKENAEHWLKLSHDLSQRSLERAVAKVNPRSLVEEGSRFISENTLELRAAISAETDEIVRRAQDILCQSRGQAVSMDEVLKAMAQLFLEKNDPVVKAARVLKKELRKDSSLRRVKQNIYVRDQGQCQARNPDGTLCEDSRWIDFHHIMPKSQGGPDTIENLVTLCKAHHQLEHSGGPILARVSS